MVVVGWGLCFFFFLVRLPAVLCCEAMVWALTFLAFPLRMLTALERERKLGSLIVEMQAQMDHLVCENKDLDDKLRAAIREQEAMDALLDEMEDEHDQAFARIDALQAQLKALRHENMRLNEHKGKSMWDKAPPPPPPVASARERESEDQDAVAARTQPKSAAAFIQKSADPASVLALTTATAAPPAAADDEEQQQAAKLAARRRSLFSVGMSLAVGAVAWSADAPCLPLLSGLFAVVGVSMRTVSRCCGALRSPGPAGDAVALLSLNWFLLGALTSPMLPGVAHAVVPRAGRVLGSAFAWFAAAAPT